MTPPQSLRDTYRAYIEMYGSMLQDLANDESAIDELIVSSDEALSPVLRALRQTIKTAMAEE